jgi:predicted HNH restriction endonuclease
VVEIPSADVEVLLKQIRTTLYQSYGNGDESDRKYRWFFYSKGVEALWIDKKTAKQQRVSSAVFDVRMEEDATDLEGDKEEITGYRIRRSAKLVKATKERDNYTCRACGFHFEKQIVHVHHLDPISEYKNPRETKLKDLITLCPTCHYLAHYWLRIDSSSYKRLETLLAKLSVA